MAARATKDILRDLCAFNMKSADPMERLPHDCYMILVGRLRSKHHYNQLYEMLKTGAKNSDREDDPNHAEYEILNSEGFESILEHIVLEGSTDQLEIQRKSHFVYEDNFNSSVLEVISQNSSYEYLESVCRHYETRDGVNVKKIMKEHVNRVDQSFSYFTQKQIPKDEAKALALSLSFYTGTKSEACNRGASLIARKSNGEVFSDDIEKEMNEAAIILYYLVKALAYIPFHWGFVTRAINLTNDELNLYIPGNLITWIQFSSSKKGKKAVDSEAFRNRNALFKIFCLTGRPIKEFSNYPEEDEVLFLPHSTFLVYNRKVFYEGGGKQVIYMRQVELGLCEWSVLWVDDRIYDENWENKKHMEYAAANALDLNVHFIPKSSSEYALSFLRSEFGKRLKNRNTFRIVTDMNRVNENPSYNAGARLVREIRRMGYRNECLIFTSDKETGEEILRRELNSDERRNVMVSTDTRDLRKFVNFDRKTVKSQYSSNTNSYQNMPGGKSATSKYDSTANYSKNHNIEPDQDVTGHSHSYSSNYHVLGSTMMHNPTNTDINMLIKNCKERNLGNSRDNCVLLTTGSFNPIHRLHFLNLLRVKEFIEHEKKHSWNVVGAYLSPTHDDYVHGKLGNVAWIPSKHRCQLAEEALHCHEQPDLSSWISISRGESEWKDGFVDFGPVAENLRDFLNETLFGPGKPFKYPLRVVYVCGLDHFNKCSYVETMARANDMGCAVVNRFGYDEKEISVLVRKSTVIYVPLSKEICKNQEISSTAIREYFQNPNNSKKNIERCIYPNVMEYMRKKYRHK